LIELIMGMGELHHLLLIGAYRKNEVDGSHPLMTTLDTVVKNGSFLRYIDVSPLSPDSVTNMIADMLHKKNEDVKDLAELITFKNRRQSLFRFPLPDNTFIRNVFDIRCRIQILELGFAHDPDARHLRITSLIF